MPFCECSALWQTGQSVPLKQSVSYATGWLEQRTLKPRTRQGSTSSRLTT
jgi:hypothetical protein